VQLGDPQQPAAAPGRANLTVKASRATSVELEPQLPGAARFKALALQRRVERQARQQAQSARTGSGSGQRARGGEQGGQEQQRQRQQQQQDEQPAGRRSGEPRGAEAEGEGDRETLIPATQLDGSQWAGGEGEQGAESAPRASQQQAAAGTQHVASQRLGSAPTQVYGAFA
jgi:hypothetical protein